MKKIMMLAAGFALLASCGDNDGGIRLESFNLGEGVFVCNEGQYGSPSGSLTFYDKSTSYLAQNNVYRRANGTPAGGGCNSMSIIGNRGYIAMMEEGKVLVVNPGTMKHIATVTGLSKPSYVIEAGPSKIYVADMYLNELAVVSTETFRVTGTILLGDPEPGDNLMLDSAPVRSGGNTVSYHPVVRAVASGNYVYVCNWVNPDFTPGTEVFRVDRTHDEYVDALTVTQGPSSAVIDKNGIMWVLSDGKTFFGENVHATLTKIDLAAFEVEGDPIAFGDSNAVPTRLTINGAGDRLYFIGNQRGADFYDRSSGVYSMSIDAATLPATPNVADPNGTFYGLGVDPVSGEIYVGDKLDVVEAVPGKVYRYSADGLTELAAFDAGLFPGSFCFKQ